ncbi:MAG: glycosyltransferase [bacterium]
MKRILIISYYYPPLLDVGALRALGFSRYLPEYGWQPYVVSVKNPDPAYCLLGEESFPSHVQVSYTRSLVNLARFNGLANGFMSRVSRFLGKDHLQNLADILFLPDIFVGWVPLSCWTAYRLIRKYRIEVIYVSAKPFSSTLTGTILKRLTGKFLILDFRDPISLEAMGESEPKENRFYWRTIRRLEKLVLSQTDWLLVTSRKTQERYIHLYPFLKDKCSVIYNGFLDELLPAAHSSAGSRFSIIYTGNFYPTLPGADIFFEGLHQVLAEGKILRDKIRFYYFGDNEKWFHSMKVKYQLHGVIQHCGYTNRKRALQHIADSSLFLLRSRGDMISAKLYEALAIGKPILSLDSTDEVAQLIRNYSSNFYLLFAGDGPEKVAGAIHYAYERWEKGDWPTIPNEEYLERFNKRRLTQQMASVLERVR